MWEWATSYPYLFFFLVMWGSACLTCVFRGFVTINKTVTITDKTKNES